MPRKFFKFSCNVNLINQGSQTILPSDKEMLSETNNQAQSYQQAWRGTSNFYDIGEILKSRAYYCGDIIVDKWDMNFTDTIENKLQSNKGSNIAQQDKTDERAWHSFARIWSKDRIGATGESIFKLFRR